MKAFIFMSLMTLALLTITEKKANAQNNYSTTTEGELAQLLAPIALYPDTLLSHILIASTYPIEVVEAYRWLEQNNQLDNNQLFEQTENKNWDASIKALLPFPTVLKRLNDELTWSRTIGDAFLEDESQVLAVIQQLRQQADEAGNLAQMDNMEVNYEHDNIIIQPVKREVVYVPYYDSRSIYGHWYWNNYPPVYWANTRVRMGYRHYSPFYWQPGIHISFNYFFGAFHWNQRQLVVINHHNSHRFTHRKRIISSHGSQRWHHKPQHRRGVAYSNNKVKKRYNSHKVSVAQRQHQRKSPPKVSRHQQLVAKQKHNYKKSIGMKHSKHIQGASNRTNKSIKNQLSHKGSATRQSGGKTTKNNMKREQYTQTTKQRSKATTHQKINQKTSQNTNRNYSRTNESKMNKGATNKQRSSTPTKSHRSTKSSSQATHKRQQSSQRSAKQSQRHSRAKER